MVLYNVGSVVSDVSNFIGPSNVPSNLSGTNMNFLVVKNINYLNTYTNDAIGIVDINVQYQPSLFSLTVADILDAVEATQGGIDSVSLGELSVGQGAGGNSEIARQMREDAINKMKELGRYSRYKRVISG
jgi:hypothetical protein